ncbi:hypothetical protein S245_024721 [Arachis hypogaea]
MKSQFQEAHGKSTPNWKAFGVPIVSKHCNVTKRSNLHDLYLKLLNSLQTEESLENLDLNNKPKRMAETEGTESPHLSSILRSMDHVSNLGLRCSRTPL